MPSATKISDKHGAVSSRWKCREVCFQILFVLWWYYGYLGNARIGAFDWEKESFFYAVLRSSFLEYWKFPLSFYAPRNARFEVRDGQVWLLVENPALRAQIIPAAEIFLMYLIVAVGAGAGICYLLYRHPRFYTAAS